jgi:hypothetical protein
LRDYIINFACKNVQASIVLLSFHNKEGNFRKPCKSMGFFKSELPSRIILMRLRLLPYYILRQLFENSLKLTQGLWHVFLWIFLLLKWLQIWKGKVKKTDTLCHFFNNPHVQNIKPGAGVGAASRYGSCSTKMVRLRLRTLL